jgi:hypothetical protein
VAAGTAEVMTSCPLTEGEGSSSTAGYTVQARSAALMSFVARAALQGRTGHLAQRAHSQVAPCGLPLALGPFERLGVTGIVAEDVPPGLIEGPRQARGD